MFSVTQVAAKVFVILFLTLVIFYLALPTHPFPTQPPDSVQSLEKADTETPARRAYFTNFTREQVRKYYQRQLSQTSFLGIPMPILLLNYPPEDAFSLIRDQTRSTGLEEIVQPFRESLFINFFEPRNPKDAVSYRGVHYFQKITVKYAPTNITVRVAIIFTAIVLLLVLLREFSCSIYDLLKIIMRRQS